MFFLLLYWGSIRKDIVEVSHIYKKLIYKLNVVSQNDKASHTILVKVSILYLSSITVFYMVTVFWFSLKVVQN